MSKSEEMKAFGLRVRKYRTEREMTLQELADKCGYTSRASINKIENGEVDVPTSKVQLIADALGVSPLDLMGKRDEPEGYYLNEETAQIAQQIYEDKELRALFDAARDADPEALQAAQAMLKVLKRKERGS